MKMFKYHVCTIKDGFDIGLSKLPRKAPWLQKFKRKFRMTTLISPKNPRSQLYYRTNTAISIERRRHIASDYSHIIHPFSIFRTRWEMFMMIIFFIYLSIVPIIVAFFDHIMTSIFILVCSYTTCVLDFVCITDICLTFFTGYTIDHLKQVILDPRDIVWNYLFSSLFVLDVLSSMPTELIVWTIDLLATENAVINYINLVSMLKFFRIRTLLIYMGRAADLWGLTQWIFSAVKYLILVYITIHWCGCFQFIIPKYWYLWRSNETRSLSSNSWLLVRNTSNWTLLEMYVEGVYKASSQLLCISRTTFQLYAAEDITTEIIVNFLGYTLTGIALVVFLQIMFRAHKSDIKYHSIMNQLSQYMRHKQLPIEMQKRLIDYYEYRFRKSYFREETVFATLSERLRKDINSHVCKELIKKVGILKDLSGGPMENILLNLKPEVFLPNDIIVKAGMTGDCMYFIHCGTVAVYTPTGKEVCHLQDGAFFGEMGLIAKDQKRIANVVAIEMCEVYRLDRKHFNKYIRESPELFKKFERVAERRRENTLVMEEIHRKHILERTMRMMDEK